MSTVNTHSRLLYKIDILPLHVFGGRFGPLDIEDEMVVSEAVKRGDRFGCVILSVEIDEGKSTTQPGHFILGEVNASDVAEGLEQLL